MTAKQNDVPAIADLLKAYDLLVKNIDSEATSGEGETERAYGGIVRAGKGLLVESLGKGLIQIAWHNLGGDPARLSFEKDPIIVPIKKAYIDRISNHEVKQRILDAIDKYYYRFKTDIHVYIDDDLAIGVECKAYTENAMLKRIMVDFTFLKQAHPQAAAVLLQLESQLGGDYGEISKEIIYGSYPTHTIMSYFDVGLNIITLLEGERKVGQPIHKKDFYKQLDEFSVQRAVGIFENLLKRKL